MHSEILYVELKTGYNDNGPAWVGRGFFSRTGRTLYFNGMAFSKANVAQGNFFCNGDHYWISGIKKQGTNRHMFGKGKILVDKSVADEFLKIICKDTLPKGYELTILDNTIIKDEFYESNNEKL